MIENYKMGIVTETLKIELTGDNGNIYELSIENPKNEKGMNFRIQDLISEGEYSSKLIKIRFYYENAKTEQIFDFYLFNELFEKSEHFIYYLINNKKRITGYINRDSEILGVKYFIESDYIDPNINFSDNAFTHIL